MAGLNSAQTESQHRWREKPRKAMLKIRSVQARSPRVLMTEGSHPLSSESAGHDGMSMSAG